MMKQVTRITFPVFLSDILSDCIYYIAHGERGIFTDNRSRSTFWGRALIR
jgi:hypothetical protein